MNILTKLAMENKENYNKYLEIMTTSAAQSTKGQIPFHIKGDKILDVGCGSGVLLEKLRELYPNKEIIGLDLNEKAAEVCEKKGFRVITKELKDVDETFDTIIFSSVLHEISSYAIYDAFTYIPIENTLTYARHKLNKGGRIIIRDGVKAENCLTNITFKTPQVVKDYRQYLKDIGVRDNSYSVITTITDNQRLLKEFCYTYTWGKDSYAREVKENFGILTKKKWFKIVEYTGLKVTLLETHQEEYLKYLEKFCVVDDNLKALFNDAVIFIIAEKV